MTRIPARILTRMTPDPFPLLTPTVGSCQAGYGALMLRADQACPDAG
jgi:hypothetical protein